MLPKRIKADDAPKLKDTQPAPETPEQTRARKNAEGRDKGCLDCPGCGDSHWWKPFHVTEFFAGELEGDNAARFHGALGICAICEECWPKMTPQDRLPHILKMLDLWGSQIPSVKKKVVKEGKFGKEELVDDPDDVKRHAKDVAEMKELREQLTKLVLQGE